MKRTLLEIRKVDNRLWIQGEGFGLWASKARIEDDFVDFYDEHGYVLATFYLRNFDLCFPTELRDTSKLLEEEVANV